MTSFVFWYSHITSKQGIYPVIFDIFTAENDTKIQGNLCVLYTMGHIKKRADHCSRLFVKSYSLHHHCLLAAVAEGKHKPSVIVNGDVVNDSVKTAVTPFGVKDIVLSNLK